MSIKRFNYQKLKLLNVITLALLASALLSCGPAGKAFWLEVEWGVRYAVNVDGYWSKWWREDFNYYGITRSGGGSDYIVYPAGNVPSNYFLRIHIDNYSLNKNEFDGWVEYYVSEFYPTVKSVFTNAYQTKSLVSFPRPQQVVNTVKRKAKAKIIVVKRYKKSPQVVNCWFDNVGLAMDLTMVAWGE